jgi:hypothetical protein
MECLHLCRQAHCKVETKGKNNYVIKTTSTVAPSTAVNSSTAAASAETAVTDPDAVAESRVSRTATAAVI